jgi:hypothetical protein
VLLEIEKATLQATEKKKSRKQWVFRTIKRRRLLRNLKWLFLCCILILTSTDFRRKSNKKEIKLIKERKS